MKKVFALLMVLVLACALCVPALAAGTTYNKKQIEAKRGEVPAAVLGAFDAVVAKIPDAGVTVDVAAVKAIKADVENALNNTAAAGTVDQVLADAVTRLDAAVDGISVSGVSVSVDPFTGKVSVSATVAVNDQTVGVSAAATAQKVKDTSGTGSSSSTTSNTAAAASSVIKATGFDTTAVVMVILAIAGVLGVATVKARKLD